MSNPSEIIKPKSKLRNYGLRLIGVAIFIYFIAKVDTKSVLTEIDELSVAGIVGSFVLMFLNIVGKIIKWREVLGVVNIHEPLVRTFRVQNDALFWGSITPGRIGEFKRVADLKGYYGLGVGRSIGLCLVDRGFDVLSVFILFLTSCAFEPWTVAFVPRQVLWLLMSGLVAGLLFHRPILRRIPFRGEKFKNLTQDLLALSLKNWIILAFTSLTCWLFYILAVYLLSQDIGISFSYGTTVTLVCLVAFGAFLPISFYNFGTREAVLIVSFGILHRTQEQALLYSLMMLLSYIFFTVINGIFALVGKALSDSTPAVNIKTWSG